MLALETVLYKLPNKCVCMCLIFWKVVSKINNNVFDYMCSLRRKSQSCPKNRSDVAIKISET